MTKNDKIMTATKCIQGLKNLRKVNAPILYTLLVKRRKLILEPLINRCIDILRKEGYINDKR